MIVSNMNTAVRGRVLITDDEADVRWTLAHLMKRQGLEPMEAATGEAALRILRTEMVDVVLVDLRMPGMSGLELLKEVRQIDHGTPVILITGVGSIESAVEAMKNGAQDYVTKPIDTERLSLAVRRALRTRCPRHKCFLPGPSHDSESLREVMGSSERISQLIAEVELVAPTDFTVLITGETGSGKEVVVDRIHRLSRRAAGPFVPVDCGSITETLMESELFGHEKGSYTGAHKSQPGKLELASGGTLFLDEISNLSLALQAKLLRALEERKIWRIGGIVPIDVDIRVVVAANRDLSSMVLTKQFRKDLYYRLNEFSMIIPPLRERLDDVVFLAKRFLESAKADLGKDIQGFSQDAVELLLSYDWPGNVRELRNLIRRAALRCHTSGAEVSRGSPAPGGLRAPYITPEHLAIGPGTGRVLSAPAEPAAEPGSTAPHPSFKQIIQRTVAQVEKQVITEALIRTKGNKAEAARMLKVDYKTMHVKVKKYEICQPTTGGNYGQT